MEDLTVAGFGWKDIGAATPWVAKRRTHLTSVAALASSDNGAFMRSSSLIR